MKISHWCHVVENGSIFSARLKALSDRSGDHSAGGRVTKKITQAFEWY